MRVARKPTPQPLIDRGCGTEDGRRSSCAGDNIAVMSVSRPGSVQHHMQDMFVRLVSFPRIRCENQRGESLQGAK